MDNNLITSNYQQLDYPGVERSPSLRDLQLPDNVLTIDDHLQNRLNYIQNNIQPEQINDITTSLSIPQGSSEYSITPTSKNKGTYQELVQELDKQIQDPMKKNILLKIAQNESNFNSKAKNPKSTASGLFGFLDSTKQKFGYGNTIAEQVAGASRLYDANSKQLQSWISKYGTNGKNYGQLMYGMWFRPGSLQNYLAKGQDSYKDPQGTGLNKIFAKMAKKGGILKAQTGTALPNTPSMFKQYGINPNKFVDMFNALRTKGLSNQVSFETAWQSIKEQPKGYYSFGQKAQNLNDWADKANRSLTIGRYKAARDSVNFNDFRNKTLQYNRLPTYTNWLKTGRDSGKYFINQYIKNNNLGQPIAQINNNVDQQDNFYT